MMLLAAWLLAAGYPSGIEEEREREWSGKYVVLVVVHGLCGGGVLSLDMR